MFWLRGPDGKPLPEFNREKLRECGAGISIYGTQMNWRPDCGLTIVAFEQRHGNPQLAQAVRVAMIDAAAYYDYEANRFPQERDAYRASPTADARRQPGRKF